MNCKHCGAELDGSAKVCPECGKTQEPEKKQTTSIGKIIAATAVCVLLLVVLAVAVIYGITGELPYIGSPAENTQPTTVPTTDPSATVAPPSASDLGMKVEGITDRATFFGEDDALQAAGGKVVATVGAYKLTNGQLQVGFWMEFYNFVNNNSSYLSYYGLDPTQPLEEQFVMTSDVTWEQYFLDIAVQTWQQYAAFNIMADGEGYQPSGEYETAVSGISGNLQSLAEQNDFASVEELLQSDMGMGCTEEDYVEYMKLYYRAMDYIDHLYLTIELSRDEVEAYFDENADDISASYGVSKETGLLMDVRHILLQPEGATTDSNGYVTATEEQWEACRAEAQKMLDDWAANGAKEEDFAALANEHSTDGGSNTNGGLYQYVTAGQMVTNFNDWLFAEGRKAGDYGLVKTEFGYHLMYCAGGDEAWYIYGKDLATTDSITDRLEAAKEASPLDVDLDSMILGRAKALEEEPAEATDPTEAGTTPTETTAPATTGAAQ